MAKASYWIRYRYQTGDEVTQGLVLGVEGSFIASTFKYKM
jgi:hypothetical protein